MIKNFSETPSNCCNEKLWPYMRSSVPWTYVWLQGYESKKNSVFENLMSSEDDKKK